MTEMRMRIMCGTIFAACLGHAVALAGAQVAAIPPADAGGSRACATGAPDAAAALEALDHARGQ